MGGPWLSRAPIGQSIFFPKSQLLRTLDFLETAARLNTQILNTDVYVTAIADGRTRFLEEVNVRPSFRFSAYGSHFSA